MTTQRLFLLRLEAILDYAKAKLVYVEGECFVVVADHRAIWQLIAA